MKQTFIIIASLIITGTSLFSGSNRNYSRLLAKYVSTGGSVNYRSMFKDPVFMNTYHEFKLKLMSPGRGAKRNALLINAYNYFVLYRIKTFYPIASVTSRKNFFTGAFLPYMGRRISLNTLEKRILFKYFPDARLHFVLVCGAKMLPSSDEQGLQGIHTLLAASKQNSQIYAYSTWS